MIVDQSLKMELGAKGWTYHGLCACSVPMHEFKKGKLKIAISKEKNLWNIFNTLNRVIALGSNRETLIASISIL